MEPIDEKPKRTRTMSPEALEALAKAREKANTVLREKRAAKKQNKKIVPEIKETEPDNVVHHTIEEIPPQQEQVKATPEISNEAPIEEESPREEEVTNTIEQDSREDGSGRLRYRHYIDSSDEEDDEQILVSVKTLRKLKKKGRNVAQADPPKNQNVYNRIQHGAADLIQEKLRSERISELLKATYGV
jgi:outer membrane biosynthesis protein TonB